MLNIVLVISLSAVAAKPAPARADASLGGPETPLRTSPQPVTPTDVGVADAERRVRAVEAKDESIYVVQRRSFSKSGKLEVSPLFFTALNPKFVGYVGGAVSVAYHVRENLAVEVVSSLPYGTYTYYSNLVAEVYRYEGLTPEDVDLKRMTYFGGPSLQFSALYGKVRFYGWLMDYDVYLTAGLGYVRTAETCNPKTDEGCGDKVDIGRGLRSPLQGLDRHKIAGNLGGGMRFFFSDMLGVRIEARDVAYADRVTANNTTSTDIRNNLLLFLGMSLMI
jgi:outer membrane beta-barrel protein